MRLLISLLALCLLAQQSNGQPTLIMEPGQPIEAIWPSGNRAQVQLGRFDLFRLGVPMQVTENLCGQSTGQIFETFLYGFVDRLSWRWIQHQDANKVGRELIIDYGQGKVIAGNTTIIISNGMALIAPELTVGLPPDEIEFPSTNWLPGMEIGEIQPLLVESWSGEMMVPNTETGVIENRIVSGAYNVQIQPKTANSFTIQSYEYPFTLTTKWPHLFLFGDMVTWIVRTSQGPCQISIKPDLGPLLLAWDEYGFRDPDTWAPYRWKQDALSDLVAADFWNEAFFAVE